MRPGEGNNAVSGFDRNKLYISGSGMGSLSKGGSVIKGEWSGDCGCGRLISFFESIKGAWSGATGVGTDD